jgi:hypothetical protein
MMYVKFSHETGAMRFRRLQGNAQGRRDLPRGLPLRYQVKHLALAWSEGGNARSL